MKRLIFTTIVFCFMYLFGCSLDLDDEGLWKGGHIGYYFSGSWTGQEVLNIRAAMDEWQACGSSIHFVQTYHSKFYRLKIIHSGSNMSSATLGSTTFAVMTLSEDATMPVLRHELGHVIGLSHEHSRTDRDSYVIIHWENIIPSALNNFRLKSLSQIYYNIGLIPYDFSSIMTYGPYAFSQNGKPTITKLDGSVLWPTREYIQESDCMKVVDIY